MSRDRVEAMVAKRMPAEWHRETVHLLRREQAALVRAVKRLGYFEASTSRGEGYIAAINDVLALLAGRKGKKTCD